MERFKVIEWRKNSIEKVEIIKESEHFVWINEKQREGKKTNYHIYFDSYNDAKQYLINKQHKHIGQLENRIKEAKEKLEKYLNL